MKTIKVAVITVAASMALTATAYAETLKIQSSFNSGDFSSQYLIQNWLPKLKTMTGGRIEMDLLPTKSVVSHRETPEAVSSGVLDGDWTSIPYFSGREPAFAILGDLISGYDTPTQMRWFCQYGPGETALQGALDSYTGGKIKVIGCGPFSREALSAAVPIRGFSDLKGKKIRSPEGLASAVFNGAGASPVAIPFSEVYTSLEKGIVDAADASAYVNNDAVGLNKIAKYPLYPGIHSMPSMQFTINKAKYNKMRPEDQKALRAWWYMAMEAMTGEADARDKELVARDKAGGKIEVINWAQVDRDKLREVARKEWQTFAKKTDRAQAALDAQLEFMTQIGLIN